MMQLSNEIVLRPRFNFDVDYNISRLQSIFKSSKNGQSEVIVHTVDDHVFLKIPKDKQHFWSPQLHLEFLEVNTDKTKLFGVFGPNPTVWTLFMFLHFVVVGLFIGFSIWTYTNWRLDTGFSIQLFLTSLMVVIWFVLYFAGRLGKKASMDQMHQLHRFMRDTLRSI